MKKMKKFLSRWALAILASGCVILSASTVITPFLAPVEEVAAPSVPAPGAQIREVPEDKIYARTVTGLDTSSFLFHAGMTAGTAIIATYFIQKALKEK